MKQKKVSVNMTLFDYVIEQSQKGKKIKIDLKNGSLKINKVTLIENCVLNHDKLQSRSIDEMLPIKYLMSPKDRIEELYEEFATSIPSKETAQDEIFGYFEANKMKELSIQDMLNGTNRAQAKAKLETYVLCCKLLHLFDFDKKHYYWKSDKFKKLIILREWIEK